MTKTKKIKTILDKMDKFAPSMYDANCNRSVHQHLVNFGWVSKN